MTLVTGGTGFVGRHLLERLAAEGVPTRALVRRETALPRGVEAVRGDLLAGQGLGEALRGVDSVIHLAGVTKALRREDYWAGNAAATRNLAAAVAGRGARLVHVSSLAAIGPSLDGKPLGEDAPPHPPSTYGKSKLEGERIVRELTPEAVIVRPAVVYGPGDTDVFKLLEAVARGWVVEIAGGERWFSAIYVKDLVAGILAAARSPRAAGRDYFLAHPEPLTWHALSGTAARILGRKPRRIAVPLPLALAVGACAEAAAWIARKPGIVSREKIREARFPFWTCATGRASEELGFTAATGIEAGLREALAWYKEAGWLKC